MPLILAMARQHEGSASRGRMQPAAHQRRSAGDPEPRHHLDSDDERRHQRFTVVSVLFRNANSGGRIVAEGWQMATRWLSS